MSEYQGKWFERVEKRVRLHDKLVTASYDDSIDLTVDERIGLRRLAQMVADGVTVFTSEEFGDGIGRHGSIAVRILEKLSEKPYERKFTMPDGSVAETSGYLAGMEHVRMETESGKVVHKFELSEISSGKLFREALGVLEEGE